MDEQQWSNWNKILASWEDHYPNLENVSDSVKRFLITRADALGVGRIEEEVKIMSLGTEYCPTCYMNSGTKTKGQDSGKRRRLFCPENVNHVHWKIK